MSAVGVVQGRREAVCAGVAAGLALAMPAGLAAEAPPETTRLRLADTTVLCNAPQFVIEELLRGEGFDRIEFVQRSPEVNTAVLLGAAEADISLSLTPVLLLEMDAGRPLMLLAGVHVGCYEMFASPRIRAIRDLKGKVVSIPRRDGGSHIVLQMILSNIGIDPRDGVEWRIDRWADVPRLLEAEQIDAYLGFPPEPQELRARAIGRVIFSTRDDRPWSQYFCCSIGANREFVHRHPVATKRALRAILKGADLCAAEPERAARVAAAHNPRARFEDVLQMVKELRYGTWRDFSAEDTARFFALRLREIGMIRSSPTKLLAQGTDWRFLDLLKRELKT
jgi:NitT/TauT family transport system substrate-binding protein